MMKRILALFCALLMIFSAAACAKKQPAETHPADPSDPGTDSLSATGLYAAAQSAREKLLSDQYVTEIEITLSEGPSVRYTEKRSIKVCETRIGFDNFAYSRRVDTVAGEESDSSAVFYENGAATILSADGNFTAPASLTVFQNYLNHFVPDVWYFDLSLFGEAERDGMEISYSTPLEGAAAIFAPFFDDDAENFAAEKISGKAAINEKGLIGTEEVALEGVISYDGVQYDLAFRMKTELRYYNDAAISCEKVPEDAACIHINDIRIPVVYLSGMEALTDSAQFNANITDSKTLLDGENQSELYTTGHLNKTGSGKDLNFNVQKQNLLRRGGAVESNTLEQILAQNSAYQQRLTNLQDGATLSDQGVGNCSESQLAAIWKDFAFSAFPGTKDFETLSMTENASSYLIEFTLNSDSLKANAASVYTALTNLPADLSAQELSAVEFTGSITVSKENGALTALSYSLSASFSLEEKPCNVTRRFSFAVNAFTGVVIEPVTDPGAQEIN